MRGAEPSPADSDATLDRLVMKSDPDQDADWPSESFEARASGVLKRLGRALATGAPGKTELAAVFAPGARVGQLRPRAFPGAEVARGVTLARLEAAPAGGALKNPPSVPRAFVDLLRPFGGVAPRFKFKIIGVQLRPDRGPWTLVRYEAAGAGSRGVVQHTGRFSIDWTAADNPLIEALAVESLDEVTSPAPWFEEVTASLLTGPEGQADALRLGADYWFGRIDGLGEPNLMGHQGLALGDIDGDGLEDLYVAMATGLPNLLLRQRPDGTLVDVAAEAGVDWLDDTKGVLFADIDNDGDQDLLCAIGPTIVLGKNDGHGRFERFVALRAPTPAAFYSISVADYDLDGDLDIYGTRYVKTQYGVSVPIPFHDAENGPTNHLLRNDGDDRFTDVTVQSGLDVNNTRFSLVGAWADYDDDGDPDLYVANDFGRNNLYRNDGGTFVDVAAAAGVEDQAAGMGVSWGDFDLDGDLDLYVTNMFSAAGKRVAYQERFHHGAAEATRREIQRHSLGNTLLANQGDGTFRDISDAAGVRMGRWGWGGRFVDLDNDGRDDIVVPNGFVSGPLEDDL